MMNLLRLHSLLLLFIGTHLLCQESSQKRLELENRLDIIVKEMSRLESRIKTTDDKLKVEQESVNNIDKQITLTHEKIDIYKNNMEYKKTLISELELQIDSLQSKIGFLKSILKDQVIFAYKYLRTKHYDWLLGAKSFNDALVRYQYYKKVTDAEKTTYLDLYFLQSKLSGKEQQLTSEIEQLENFQILAQNEAKNLSEKRSIKTGLISKIKKDKTLLIESLNAKKRSYQNLLELITSLENGKSIRELNIETQIKWEKLSGSFAKNKGKFNWPVQGELLHGYGQYKNPELKTTLNNTGIDIKAKQGTPIRSIFSGVISLITYMPGFGNMVIIDHNDGYYSVYTHIDEIVVNNGDFVEQGSSIGTIGDSGSFEGSKLHFEIYSNNKNLNPLDWLKRM
jgi:septal ring factor EnvC (AmiA/AmiB activator)